MKKHLKNLALLFLTFLAFSSCEKDLYQDTIVKENKSKKISFQEFKNQTQVNDLGVVFKMPVKAGETSRATAISDFIVDTLTVEQYINTTTNKSAYSFRVYPTAAMPDSDDRYNLIYKKQNNVWQKTIIYFEEKTPLAPNHLQLENVKKLYDSSNPTQILNEGLKVCSNSESHIECDGSCADAGYSECDGFACNTGQCVVTTVTIVACDIGGSGPSAPGGGSIPGVPNVVGGNIPTDPFSFNANMFDNPVFDNANYVNTVKAYYFFHNLPNGGQVWANENVEAYFAIINYQIANNWSAASNTFANQLISYSNSQNNSPESVEEIKNILDILDDGLINGQSAVAMPDTPITNMADYLSCFNTSQPATITLYADQPITGQYIIFSPTLSVGHGFISIKQGTKVKTFGLYPKSTLGSVVPNSLTPQPNDFLSTPGIFGNDQGHEFDVSISMPITPSGLASVINSVVSIAQNNPQYNINTRNCADLAITIFESQTGVNVPSCQSPGAWYGQTPGALGEVIRVLPVPAGGVINTTGGNAPTNNSN